MDLEPLVRLIESTDFVRFREIAFRYLELAGYRDVSFRDGSNDGGSDFAVGTLGANQTKLAIQVTVQKSDWKAKVKADFRRAKSELGLEHGIYITSRRIPQSEFAQISNELWSDDGITIRAVDSQIIGSTFFSSSKTGLVLETLGIKLDVRRPDPVPVPDLKEDAAYSFAFFGDASRRFRESVVEQTILSYLTSIGAESQREMTESEVVTALRLSDDQIGLVSAAVDRMLQRQQLSLCDTMLRVDETVNRQFAIVRAIRESQWRQLGQAVETYLGDIGLAGATLESATTAVMTGAGALFMTAASSTSTAVGMGDPRPVRHQLRRRMRDLGTALLDAGISERDLDRHLGALADVVSNSDIGVVLMAGELFVNLVSLNTNNLERALGATGGSKIYLDASAAIPMLLGLLYEPARQRYSLTSMQVYRLSRRRGIPLLLPRPYLEEAATHLLSALEYYEPVLGQDNDLRYSTNAYVAHYTDLTARAATETTFLQFVEGLGYRHSSSVYDRRRDALMEQQTLLFHRYGIEVVDLPKSSKETIAYAEEAVTFTAHERKLKRAGVVLGHDAEVIAYFMDGRVETDVARFFCTWDRLHLHLETHEGRVRWDALTPPTLVDLLLLTRPDGVGELLTTANLAMELSDEHQEQGAAVWDELVRLERQNLHDADNLALAKEFKDAWVAAVRQNAAPEHLAEAWAEWKSGNRDLIRQPKLPM